MRWSHLFAGGAALAPRGLPLLNLRPGILGLLFSPAICLQAASPVITAEPVSQTIFIGSAATFEAAASGSLPLSYQWLRDGVGVSGANGNTLMWSRVAAADDQARFSLVVTNAYGAVTSAPAVLTVDLGMPGPTTTSRWVETMDVWRYNVNKTNLPTTWTASDYSDSDWPQGGGVLYVEDSALPAPKTTALPLTPGNLPRTCYFRTRFNNDITNAYSLRLVAQTVLDDGVVFHLNGVEALRIGMPEGAIAYDTFSARTVGDAAWEGPFEIPADQLVPGTNVLAAEVHQVNSGSTDIVLGMTLDAVWQPRLQDTRAPLVLNVEPAIGGTVAALKEVRVEFDERVRGVEAADLLVNGVAATNLTALSPSEYVFRFPPPSEGPVTCRWATGHGITDYSSRSNSFDGGSFAYLVAPVAESRRLVFAKVYQSSDAIASTTAGRAVDESGTTFSLTQNLPGSYWVGEFSRPFPVERVEIVNRPAPGDREISGLVFRLFNMDDQVVLETVLTNLGPGGVTVVPTGGGMVRSAWLGLPETGTNGVGTYQVGVAEIRVFGTPDMPYGPPPVTTSTNTIKLWQSSEYGGFPAEYAIDGNADTFTHTADVPDSYWLADLGRGMPIDRVEIVNRNSCCDNRLDGLVLRIFDGSSNSVASAALTNPGLGGTWTYTPPSPVAGRWIRVGLENGAQNADGNYYVTLAEARVYSGTTNVLVPYGGQAVPIVTNLASFKKSYMVRLDDSVPAASRANDDNYATETKTTERTVDGYWEVDLGNTYALYGLRAIAASGIGYRLSNTVVRLYDEAHESIYARQLSGSPDTFDMDFNGPIFARFVRVGLEDKTRTDPGGGIEFYIGFREVEVFGRPTNEVGILSFDTSMAQVAPGQPAVLSWAVEDLRRLELQPAIGSVGIYTGTNGTGQLTVVPTTSTEYILVASNTAGVFVKALGVQVGNAPLQVRISEIVAENRYSLKDGYGEAPDWIELRNPSNYPVNLLGWGLSDDAAQPMKWTFPAVNIAAHGTLIVFASGRGAVDPAGNLHAGFRLEKNGGALLLTASDGRTLIDRLDAYPELDTDLAYGRDLQGNWKYLEPTPRQVNIAATYEGWLKPLDWSHARGFHDAAFTLTLTHRNPGATVLYSRDGSAPRLPYTSGLAINGTTAIRAQVVRPGYKPARVQTKTFIFVDDVVTSPVMRTEVTQNPTYAPRIRPGLLALPTICLSVPGQPEYEEKEGSAEVIFPNRASEPVQINCGISRFGNAWTKFEKRSFRIKCRSRYGEAKLEAPIFDGFDHGTVAKTSFDELDLRSGSQDMVERGFYMAGRFVEDSMLDMGSLNPHGRFVHVYVNGIYWGQYDCRELLVDHFMADYLGGTESDYVVVRGNDNVGDDFVPGTPDPPNLEPWETARSMRGSYESVKERLDVSHLIDFMLLWNYGDCESEFRCCGPVAPGTGFKFWIADADGFLRTSALNSDRTDRGGPGGFFGGLVAESDSDFKTLLADRIYRHFYNQGALTPMATTARLANRMREINDSLLAECARWGYRNPSDWVAAANDIRVNLFPTRTTKLLSYLRNRRLYPTFDPPTFNQYGGLVTNGFQPTLASSSGTIYYTLDGTDPRLAGGDVSPLAKIWSAGAVTVTNDLMLNARVRTVTGSWSALAEPHYLLASRRAPGPGDLLVTEIHYNPAGDDAYEFIELFNASTNLLDLSGVSLTNAVRFYFPNGFALEPGGFTVVTENAQAFAARYQTAESAYYFDGIQAAGEWTGALDNAGEIVSVLASNGTLVATVPYQTGGAWPNRADGGGSSLELASLPGAGTSASEVLAWLADPKNWKASSLYHGSPGRFDLFENRVRFSELLSHMGTTGDWVEIVNTSDETVYLTGCTVTDDIALPAAWSFPANTVLAPDQLMVLPSSQLGFGFDKDGDRAFLLRMTGTNIVRFLDAVDFPAAAPEETFGLYRRTDGVFDFTELRTPTPGASNSLPRVGPVVISEVVFRPAPGMAQYVELTSVTNQAVVLYDTAYPTNTWRIEGVGNFAFPTGAELQACASLIVCSTNPAAFREQYGTPSSVAVFGPWAGNLSGDGETLRLLRPGVPVPGKDAPYYRVDHVNYETNGVWAAAASTGAMERAPSEAYGNDPASWQAAISNGTPGIGAANRAPLVRWEGSLEVNEMEPVNLRFGVADPDAPWQRSTLRALRLPPGSSLDETTGILTWTPLETQGPGVYTAEFLALDHPACGGMESSQTVSIVVREANQPPAWATQPDVEFPAGLDCIVPLTASDPDYPAQQLRFQAMGLPPGYHLETSPLRIVGTGTAPGDYAVELTALDDQTPPSEGRLQFTFRLTEPFALEAVVQPGNVQLSFPAIIGQTYAVEWCEDLAAGDWQVLQGPTMAGTDLVTVSDSVPGPAPSRFYRVRWVK